MFLTVYNGSLLGPISKLLGWIMDKIYIFFGNLGIENVALSIIVFTIFIYLCLYPLTYKQQKFSMLSQKMQPELNAVQEKYKGKKDQASMQAMQNETSAVYDKYGVSPAGSCIQLIIQMPILLALYRVFSNIPAYIGSVRKIFTGTPMPGIAEAGSLVNDIMSTNGYADKLLNIWRASNNRTISVNLSTTDPAEMCNYIVDILYKFRSDRWDSLAAIFSNCSESISSVRSQIEKVNTFIILNISETPWEIMKSNFRVSLIVCFAAAAIPIMSYISQLVSIKLMPTNSNTDDSQMGQSMKAMNNVMPLFSLFLCFTVPVGLGIYWVMGAVIRAIQQVFLNKHFQKMNLDDIIEKNKDKAARKAAKRGERAERISQMATMNTRSISEKANTNVVADTTASVSDGEGAAVDNENAAANTSDTSPSSKWPDGAPPAGSLASKANLVKEFNERNNK